MGCGALAWSAARFPSHLRALEEMVRIPDDVHSGPLIANEVTGLPFTD